MKFLIILSCFYGLIYLWLFLKYRAGIKLDELREYDRRCEIEVEREERER